MKQNKAFTLIELLVVISVIGLLGTIIMIRVNDTRTKGKYARAKADMNQLIKLADAARLESGKTFREITGSYCTECNCRNKGNIGELPESDSCWTRYKGAIDKLNIATAGIISLESYPEDPWGAPYLFNENEGENGWCFTDNLMSAGPDGQYFNSDDIVVNIPTAHCKPVQGHHHPNQNWE